MKLFRIDILSLLLVLLMAAPLSSCGNDEEVKPEQEVAESNFDLDMNFRLRSRVSAPGEDPKVPNGMMIWVYGGFNDVAPGDNLPLLYNNYDVVYWNQNELTQADEEEVEFYAQLSKEVYVDKKYDNLRVYAVINSDAASAYSITLNGDLTESQLRGINFGAIDQTKADNEQLMYGATQVAHLDISNFHSVELNAKRCQSKLEVYFAEQKDLINLKIKNISLINPIEYGLLVPPAADNLPLPKINNADIELFSSVDGYEIQSIVREEFTPEEFGVLYDMGEVQFDRIMLDEPYIFERKGLDKFEQVADASADAYILKLNYERYDVEKRQMVDEEKFIALPGVVRNTRYRLFFRVKDQTAVEVNAVVVPWETGKGTVDLDVTYGHESLNQTITIM